MNIYTKEMLKIYSHFHFNGNESSNEAISLTITALQALFLFQEVILLTFIEIILLNVFQKSIFFLLPSVNYWLGVLAICAPPFLLQRLLFSRRKIHFMVKKYGERPYKGVWVLFPLTFFTMFAVVILLIAMVPEGGYAFLKK